MNPRTLTKLSMIAALLLLLAGCASIAVDRNAGPPDTEPPVTLRLCLLKDQGVSHARAEAIVAAVRREMAGHGIAVAVPWIRGWQRPGFFEESITLGIAANALEAPCDRMLALVGRSLGDFAWGLLMPEILGAVETLTHTKGYAVAKIGSLNQVLSFQSPAAAAIHEFYHMLGCNHGVSAQACAIRIDAIKTHARQNHADGRDFFPGLDASGNPILTRDRVEAAFAGYLPEDSSEVRVASFE